jgi:RND family efflux transporter MFP subunit
MPRPVLVLLALAVAALGCAERKRAPSGPPKIPVSVEKVDRRDVPQLARGIGTVQSLHSVTLRAQLEGVLSEVLFREGQQVKRGDLLARIDDRAVAAELLAARAEKARNEAQLRAVRADLQRYENLVKDEAISRQTVDQQKAQLAQLEAAIRGNDAAIRAADVKLSYTRIVAPVSGRVGMRRVDPGNLVRPGDAEGLVTVTQMDPIAVRFSLPQDQLSRLAPFLADPARAPVVAYEREGGARLAEGHLSVIDNQVDPTTGTLSLKAELPNREGRLWPGQFVAVELTTGTAPAATVVSSRVVQRGRDGAFVFRVEDGKAVVVPVKVSWQDDHIAVIADGVAPGDTVVSDGHSRLKPGSLVNVVAPPGTRTTQADLPGAGAAGR